MTDARSLIHKVPCRECPWRKTSAQGYLGGHEPEWYADVVSDNQVPSCHLRDFGPDDERTGYCVGALHTGANSCILPRDQKEAAASNRVGPNHEECFAHPALFFAYHTFGGRYVNRLMRALTGQKSEIP